MHFHISSVLPHEIISTSAIRPYPVDMGPGMIATRTAERWLPAILSRGRRPGPMVSQEDQPETIAREANRLAGAMAAGMEAPPWINRDLLRAAKMIMKGQSFVIRSAGREIRVQPSSLLALQRQNPASVSATSLQGAQPGMVAQRSNAPASWSSIRNDLGQPGQVMQVARERASAASSWYGLRHLQPGSVMTARPWRYR